MGRMTDESDFNPDVARARREQLERDLAEATPDTLSEEN